MKTSPPLKNISRPAAFLSVKHIIMGAKDSVDIKQAEKSIDIYIYEICEKPLREERKLDLLYILNWQVGQLREKGISCPDAQKIGGYEDEIDTLIHKRLEAK